MQLLRKFSQNNRLASPLLGLAPRIWEILDLLLSLSSIRFCGTQFTFPYESKGRQFHWVFENIWETVSAWVPLKGLVSLIRGSPKSAPGSLWIYPTFLAKRNSLMGIPGSATNEVCSGKSACDFCKLQQTPWVCCFAEILKNCVAYQVFGRMCWIVYLAYLSTGIPIQTLLFVAPTLSVFWRATQFQQPADPWNSL